MLADERSLSYLLTNDQVGEFSAAQVGFPKWSWLTFASSSGRTVTFELAGDAKGLVPQ
jgi:hypothetical protein